MAFQILSDDTKTKLEQERSRLLGERQAIIDAAVAQATAEVDQMLQSINAMLGYESPAATTNGTAKAAAKPKQGKAAPKAAKAPAAKAAAKAPAAKAPAAKAAAKAPAAKAAPKTKAAPAAKAAAKAPAAKAAAAKAPATKKAAAKAPAAKAKPASAEAKPAAAPSKLALKREFKSMTPTEAVQQIMKQAGKPLTTDEVIQSLYQTVKESDLATARKSVALILGRGAYQGIYEKVEENPSRFQVKAASGQPASA